MIIETKYDIGDEVWVKVENWDGDHLESVTINWIDCLIFTATDGKVGKAIIYTVEGLDRNSGNRFHEFECFPTKEELLKSL